MIPVNQTITTDEHGNCLAACIASMLELPCTCVPNFASSDNHINAANRWLEKFGLYLLCIKADENSVISKFCAIPDKTRLILGIDYHGEPTSHAVIAEYRLSDKGIWFHIIHDPSPGCNPSFTVGEDHIVSCYMFTSFAPQGVVAATLRHGRLADIHA